MSDGVSASWAETIDREAAARSRRERIIKAIVARCTAADIHLECSYPSCRCMQMPTAIEAAIKAYERTA